MDIKVVSSIIGFALVTTSGGIAQAATETETTTTIERSTVDAPEAGPEGKGGNDYDDQERSVWTGEVPINDHPGRTRSG
jgi:hypothetical protein